MGSRGAAVTRFVLRRTAAAVPTLFGILLAVFLLLHLAPGDPGPGGAARVSREGVHALRRIYGLDRPLPAQFAEWLGRAARLDLGESFQDHRPVSARIREALPFTLELNGLALLLTLGLAVPLGVAQARRAGSAFDRVSSAALFALYSTPSFWAAMLLVTIFSVKLRWLPLFGAGRGEGAGGALAHIVLPVVCLTYGSLAFFARLVRAGVLEERSRDYVLAARARGLSDTRALWTHAVRNALVPLVTLLGLIVPGLLSGSIIVERIFGWPGLGRLYFDAVLGRDYPVVLGLTLWTAVATLAATLAADLLAAAVDPRMRDGL
jgi:peptide/nickel transport system permease protein